MERQMTYVMFDMLTLEEFQNKKGTTKYTDRLNKLKEFYQKNKFIDNLCVVNYEYYNPKTLKIWEDRVKEYNWEGLMFRKDIPYENGRTNNLLKYKNFFDAEYVVKDVVLDGNATVLVDGKTQRIKCVQSLVIEHKGYTVNVGSGLTQQQRIDFAEHPGHIIGKTITVQYFEETTDKDGKLSLRFPTIKYIYNNGRQV